MTAQQILKMIETVDPNDTAKLDEIDVRTHVYVTQKGRVNEAYYQGGCGMAIIDTPEKCFTIPSYCTSRDALKQIRPEGWQFLIDIREGNYSVCFARDCDHQKLGDWFTSATEELAELTAIIQAIEYERSHK